LIIRDTGSLVQAIIVCNNPSTFVYGAYWQVNLGAGAASGSFDINGVSSVVVWQGTVSSTMGMTLYMGDTGTSGLGGPASVSTTIQRATVPAPPTPLGLDQITPTSMRYRFSGNSDGGSPILQWQIQYGPTGSGTALYVDSGGTTVLTGLTPATSYNVYARGRNAVGWGGFSSASIASTLAAGRVKVAGVWKYAQPYLKIGGVWKAALPYVKSGGVWKTTG
jgi:hypothetical protein